MGSLGEAMAILAVHLHCRLPLFRAVHEVVLGHEEREAYHGGLVEDSEILLVVLLVVGEFVPALVDVPAQVGYRQVIAVALVRVGFVEAAAAIALQIGDVDGDVLGVGLVGRELLAGSTIEVVGISPGVVQAPVALVAVELGRVDCQVGQSVAVPVLAGHQ